MIRVRVAGPREAPDWPDVRRQLTRKGVVTLCLLWEECKQSEQNGSPHSDPFAIGSYVSVVQRVSPYPASP